MLRSVFGTRGASDCAGCVGVALEAARVLVANPNLTLPGPAVFLFNGGEETVLQASHGFMAHSRCSLPGHHVQGSQHTHNLSNNTLCMRLHFVERCCMPEAGVSQHTGTVAQLNWLRTSMNALLYLAHAARCITVHRPWPMPPHLCRSVQRCALIITHC